MFPHFPVRHEIDSRLSGAGAWRLGYYVATQADDSESKCPMEMEMVNLRPSHEIPFKRAA